MSCGSRQKCFSASSLIETWIVISCVSVLTGQMHDNDSDSVTAALSTLHNSQYITYMTGIDITACTADIVSVTLPRDK